MDEKPSSALKTADLKCVFFSNDSRSLNEAGHMTKHTVFMHL